MVSAGQLEPAARNGRKRTKCGRYALDVSFAELEQHFHLPTKQACKQLGVGLTVFKRICRSFGLHRWPYRRCSQGHKEHSEANSWETEKDTPDQAILGCKQRQEASIRGFLECSSATVSDTTGSASGDCRLHQSTPAVAAELATLLVAAQHAEGQAAGAAAGLAEGRAAAMERYPAGAAQCGSPGVHAGGAAHSRCTPAPPTSAQAPGAAAGEWQLFLPAVSEEGTTRPSSVAVTSTETPSLTPQLASPLATLLLAALHQRSSRAACALRDGSGSSSSLTAALGTPSTVPCPAKQPAPLGQVPSTGSGHQQPGWNSSPGLRGGQTVRSAFQRVSPLQPGQVAKANAAVWPQQQALTHAPSPGPPQPPFPQQRQWHELPAPPLQQQQLQQLQREGEPPTMHLPLVSPFQAPAGVWEPPGSQILGNSPPAQQANKWQRIGALADVGLLKAPLPSQAPNPEPQQHAASIARPRPLCMDMPQQQCAPPYAHALAAQGPRPFRSSSNPALRLPLNRMPPALLQQQGPQGQGTGRAPVQPPAAPQQPDMESQLTRLRMLQAFAAGMHTAQKLEQSRRGQLLPAEQSDVRRTWQQPHSLQQSQVKHQLLVELLEGGLQSLQQRGSDADSVTDIPWNINQGGL